MSFLDEGQVEASNKNTGIMYQAIQTRNVKHKKRAYPS